MVTCATPGYLKAAGVPAYPDELRNGHKLVSYLSPLTGRAFPFRFIVEDEMREIKVQHHIGVNESNAHLAAAVAGMGIIQTFCYAAKEELNNGTLVEILQAMASRELSFLCRLSPEQAHDAPVTRVY